MSDDSLSESTPEDRRAREWVGLVCVILVAAGLRLWRLDRNGFGNPYYGAAVRSMLASPGNFFFGSFDPAGIVTVDKPPVALWLQAIGAKLLGYTGLGVLLPQAFMGIASVALTYHLVRRAFGAGAGLLAGLALAITPICVAMDRDNLPDTALVLVLLLAAWAISRASETGRLGPLLAGMALVGVGFNVKMLAAFVILPTFVLTYWLTAPVSRRSRLARLSISMAVLVATSLSWSIAVELTPKDRRPYIGGSRTNSALELALGYNGIARVMGMGGFGPPGGRPGGVPPVAKEAEADGDEGPDDAFPPFPPGGPGMGPPPFGPGGPGMGMPGFGGTPGVARFANRGIAGLITWLFPLAIAGGAVAAVKVGRSRPIGRGHVALLLWAGWLGTHWVVFSFAQGIFHEYYTAAMGPAVAALAGIGAVALLEESRRSGRRAVLLSLTILLTAAWQATIVAPYPDWKRWLLPTLLGGAGVGAAGLLASRWLAGRRPTVPWYGLSAGFGLAALFVCPAVWSLTPVLTEGNSMLPTADPTMLGARRDGPSGMGFTPVGGPGSPFAGRREDTRKLVDFLVANKDAESILVAGISSMEIAPILIETGEPAVALGGFMGMDRALTKDRFIAMVEGGRLRFVLISPGPGGGGPGGPGGMPGPPPGMSLMPRGVGGPPGMGNGEILAWVRDHGRVVDPKLWRTEAPDPAPESDDEPFNSTRMFTAMRRMTRLYDCRPELGPLKPAAH